MTEYIEQGCPLCDNPAVYCWVDQENVKYFDCASCGMFQISKRAERVLSDDLAASKSFYSRLVKKTPSEHLLFIRMPSDAFRKISSEKLQAEYTPKSQLPLQ